MALVSTYLNFPNNTEEAFNFYKSVFGSEFAGSGIMRFSDIPPQDGMPPLSEAGYFQLYNYIWTDEPLVLLQHEPY